MDPGSAAASPEVAAVASRRSAATGAVDALLANGGVAMLVIGWVACWLGAPALLLIAAVAFGIWRHREAEALHTSRLQIELQHALAQPEVAHAILGAELPPWVTFPRVERSVWLNALIGQLWPHIAAATAGSLTESLNPLLERSMPSFLNKLVVERASLGAVPLRLLGVETLKDTGTSTVLDLQIAWAGEPDIEFVAGTMLIDVAAHVPSLLVKGTLRLSLGPHKPTWPCFGGISLAFTSQPRVECRIVAAKVPLDTIPGLPAFLSNFITTTLFQLMVFPRRLSHVIDAEHPSLEAVARPVATAVVSVHSAEGLPKKLLQSCDSRVVGTVTSSTKESETAVVKNTTSPDYGDKRMTFTVYGSPEERLVFTVMDRFGTIGRVEQFTACLVEKPGRHEFSSRIVAASASKKAGKLKYSVEMAPLVPWADAPAELRKSTNPQPGVVAVNIVGAVRVPRTAFFGVVSNLLKVGRSSTDYYVKASVGHVTTRTWTVANTQDPIYNWHGNLDFRDVRADRIEFRVCTSEMAADHEVASGSLMISDVADAHGRYRTTIQLEPEGELTVEVDILMRVPAPPGTMAAPLASSAASAVF